MSDWIEILCKDGGKIDGRRILAVHTQDDGYRVMLVWNSETKMYAVLEVSVQTRIINESTPIFGGLDAMDVYVDTLMAVFYRSENYTAPTFTYAHPNNRR